MLKTLKDFLDFSGEKNRKKFIISIWLGLLEAFANALKVPAVMIILQGLLSTRPIMPYMIRSVFLMIISIVIGILTKAVISVLETEAGYGCIAYKRIEMAEHLRFVPMGWFNNNTIGEITSVMTNTMDSLSNIATRVIMITTQGIMETAMVLVFLFLFDWRIGLIGFIGLVLFLLINRKLQESSGKLSEEKQACDTSMVSEIVEYLKGIAEVKSYGLAGGMNDRFARANQACCDVNTKLELQYEPWFFLQNMVIRITGAVIAGASVIFYLNSSMSLLTAVGMIICAFILFSGLQMYGNFSALLHLVQGYMGKANEVLSLPQMDINGKTIEQKDNTITFQNVDFSYDRKKIIDDVSLVIPQKKTTAIVGPSGSGKTTLVHLAARFWDVDQGSVSLGNINVKDYSFDSLMDHFSFVFQNVYLFKDTIENNIKFGKPDATHEEVVKAAELACCNDFIERLPEGYNTVIGEGGASLSGGEKQRISIARAIMKDAPVIVMDEATANIDPENEEALMQAVQALTKDKTVIMIAHRLKTVRHADQIVVLEKGRITGIGTHEELMKTNALYRSFIDTRRHAVNWQIS